MVTVIARSGEPYATTPAAVKVSERVPFHSLRTYSANVTLRFGQCLLRSMVFKQPDTGLVDLDIATLFTPRSMDNVAGMVKENSIYEVMDELGEELLIEPATPADSERRLAKAQELNRLVLSVELKSAILFAPSRFEA
jgi:hypothetical protein